MRLAFLDRDAAALPPPPSANDIVIDRVLGRGGQGTVYAGRWLGIHVALKVTRGGQTARRLQDEARHDVAIPTILVRSTLAGSLASMPCLPGFRWLPERRSSNMVIS